MVIQSFIVKHAVSDRERPFKRGPRPLNGFGFISVFLIVKKEFRTSGETLFFMSERRAEFLAAD